MSQGTENLVKLFEAKDIPKPSGAHSNWSDAELNGQFKRDLQAIVRELDTDKAQANAPNKLSHAIFNHWPKVTLELSSTERVLASAEATSKGIANLGYEGAYASGHSNAATLFLNPLMPGYKERAAGTIWLPGGMSWTFTEMPIRATERVVASQRVVPNTVQALAMYLDRIEQGIDAQIAGLDREVLTPQVFFYLGPNAGLSLIGYGDAMLKAAKVDLEREREYLALANRAYRTSGFNNTLYVGNKLLEIGEQPSNVTHYLIPASLVTKKQLKQLREIAPKR